MSNDTIGSGEHTLRIPDHVMEEARRMSRPHVVEMCLTCTKPMVHDPANKKYVCDGCGSERAESES